VAQGRLQGTSVARECEDVGLTFYRRGARGWPCRAHQGRGGGGLPCHAAALLRVQPRWAPTGWRTGMEVGRARGCGLGPKG
jgi:hypothetical protein